MQDDELRKNKEPMMAATDKPKDSLGAILGLPSMKDMAENATKREESALRVKAADLAVMVMSLKTEFDSEKSADILVSEAEIILTFLKGK